jgi:hypothetical protein
MVLPNLRLRENQFYKCVDTERRRIVYSGVARDLRKRLLHEALSFIE